MITFNQGFEDLGEQIQKKKVEAQKQEQSSVWERYLQQKKVKK